MNITDEETVPCITKNPYMQYFLGYEGYSGQEPFSPSTLTRVRKRLPANMINEISKRIIGGKLKKVNAGEFTLDEGEKNTAVSSNSTEPCAPADISYPTDVKLLNKVKEISEEFIDRFDLSDKTAGGSGLTSRTHENPSCSSQRTTRK